MSDADADDTTLRHVFRWDLDKTYLHTNFDHWIDLLRTAVETPEGKRTVPGAAALIRELRAAIPSRVTIVSGSPEQMRASLESKLRLDGVQWDEFVLKPSLRNLLRFRLRALRDQVGYKLPALLAARVRTPPDVPETLFGDDAEADALVYSLYADILADRLGDKLLTAVMEHADAYPDSIAETIRLANEVKRTDPVRRIFIHLDRRSEPEFFRVYGPRVVPVTNYFQAAVVLVGDGVLPSAGAARMAASMLAEGTFTPGALAASAADVVARGHLTRDTLTRVADAVGAPEAPLPLDAEGRAALAEALRAVPVLPAPESAHFEVSIDYLAALSDDRARWEAARLSAKGARKRRRTR